MYKDLIIHYKNGKKESFNELITSSRTIHHLLNMTDVIMVTCICIDNNRKVSFYKKNKQITCEANEKW